MAQDVQSRRWQITLNNPVDKGFTREVIKEKLHTLTAIIYWAVSDEVGEQEQTPHTHIYAVYSSPKRFSTMKRLFEGAHFEGRLNANSEQNREYLLKNGNETFEEWGECPQDQRGSFGLESVILARLQDGATPAELLREFPQCLRGLRDVEYARQTLLANEYREKRRELETTYIFGATGTGKTRFVMDGEGYANVYRVTDYKHPFDGYIGESVILFDEFNSGFRITDMNNYLDCYPLTLPARYSNKQACFERVYIVSNLDLWEQYPNTLPKVWRAFLRRIHNVIHFQADGSKIEYSREEYLQKYIEDNKHKDFVQPEFLEVIKNEKV